MDRKEFRDLMTHMEWADAQTWRAIRNLPSAQSDERLKWLCHHTIWCSRSICRPGAAIRFS